MLRHLQVRDLAVVEALDLDLGPGFTALTGETGAGKSILVDALALALGERADATAIRTGAERLEVSAVFGVATGSRARTWLQASDLDDGDECVLRRVVGQDGRSRAWINGRPATIQSLRDLATLLVDICGQQEHQSLRQRDSQREVLDEFAGHGELVTRMAAACTAARRARDALASLKAAGQDRSTRRDWLTDRLDELTTVAARPGEYASLEEQSRRLAHRGRIAEAIGAALSALEDDDRSTAASAIVAAQRQLDGVTALDPGLAPARSLLDDALIQLREAASQLQGRLDQLDADPAAESRAADRVAAMRDLARRLKVPPTDLPATHAELAAELAQLEHLDESLTEQAARVAAADADARAAASALTASRVRGARAFEKAVGAHLAGLGLAGARLRVDLSPRGDAEPGPHGADNVEILFSANPGQAEAPIGRVASGGELSRLNLAIQVVAAAAMPVGTLVFDEVDTGIGGAVAEIVGRRLQELARHRQVICITHLPQVASLADHQLTVSKRRQGGRTTTAVTALDEAGRVEETARMLGGVDITERTREHAREMLARRNVHDARTAAPAVAAPQRSRKGRT